MSMSKLKGWIGEKLAGLSLWQGLSSKEYTRFHNLFIPAFEGTAQIDHVITSPYGIFIVETKHYKGWIYGSAQRAKWTQALYKNKYSFQNPLRQAFRQKKFLALYLGIDESLIKTVIYFSGNCEFKTRMPDNVVNKQPAMVIKAHSTRLIGSNTLKRINQSLSIKKALNTTSQRQHVKALNKRHQSLSRCPHCNGELKHRIAKQGQYKGNQFLGCENFPKCRFVKPIK